MTSLQLGPQLEHRKDFGKCELVCEDVCITRVCIIYLKYAYFLQCLKKKCARAFCRWVQTNVETFYLQDLQKIKIKKIKRACVCLCTSVGMWQLREKVRFPTSVVPISLSSNSGPCFHWSRQFCGEKNNKNFICH